MTDNPHDDSYDLRSEPSIARLPLIHTYHGPAAFILPGCPPRPARAPSSKPAAMAALLNNYLESAFYCVHFSPWYILKLTCCSTIEKVLVLTVDSRILVGTLASIDNSTNLVSSRSSWTLATISC